MDYIRVFQYDVESSTVLEPEDVLIEGTATSGGFRGSLSIMEDGYGLALNYVDGMSGDAAIERITLEGDEIFYTTIWAGMLGDDTPELDNTDIFWYDVQDGSGLEY